MSIKIYLGICFLLVVLGGILHYRFLRIIRSNNFKNSFLPAAIISVIPLINISLIFFSFPLKQSFWLFSPIISVVLFMVFIITIYRNYTNKMDSSDYVMIPLVTFPLFITIFGFVLLYYLTANTVSENEIVNIKPIETSISNVKIKFNELEKIISIESSNIDNLFSEIYDEINIKNKEIKTIQLQHNQLREEINHYKRLANISQEEAKAVRKEIDKNESINYLISFALGILSSGLVWGLTQIKFIQNLSKSNK